MYSLRILFLVLPLYFSHVLSPFGIVIGEYYSFERQKVYLFLILVVCGYIEGFIRFPHHILGTIQKYVSVLILLFVIPLISSLYYSVPLDTNWLFGSLEKHHGYLLYSGVILFIILLISSPKKYFRSYLSYSIIAAIFVALIAIGEYLGGIYDIYGRSEMISMYPGRSSSTLGNPNYVAGYLLLFLPILGHIRMPERWIVLGIFVVAIMTTWSYIAITLMGLYVIYRLFRYVGIPGWISTGLILLFMLLGGFIASVHLDPEKMLSLMSRFILMKESISMMFIQPFSLLIGFGPEAILAHFSQARSDLVSAYFPGGMFIDSSHNLFIDILFQYGIIVFGFLIYQCFSFWKNQNEDMRVAILIGSVFLGLNVFVVTHLVVLALIIIAGSDQNPISLRKHLS